MCWSSVVVVVAIVELKPSSEHGQFVEGIATKKGHTQSQRRHHWPTMRRGEETRGEDETRGEGWRAVERMTRLLELGIVEGLGASSYTPSSSDLDLFATVSSFGLYVRNRIVDIGKCKKKEE